MLVKIMEKYELTLNITVSHIFVDGYSLSMMIWYMIMAEVLMYSVNARATTMPSASPTIPFPEIAEAILLDLARI